MDEKEGLRETFLCMGSSVRGQAQLSARVFWNPGRSTDHISYVWGIYTSLFPTLSSRVASYIEHLTSRLPEWHFFYAHSQCPLGKKCFTCQSGGSAVQPQCLRSLIQSESFQSHLTSAPFPSLIFLLCYLDYSHSTCSWRLTWFYSPMG